jgi:hypothetical protein
MQRPFNLIILQGRETFLVSVDWVDGWPVFNNGQKISLQSSSQAYIQEQSSVIWEDDFSKPNLQLGWYRKSKLLVSFYKQRCDFIIKLTMSTPTFRHTTKTRLLLDRPTRLSSTIWRTLYTS